jgi:hypothetical protein
MYLTYLRPTNIVLVVSFVQVMKTEIEKGNLKIEN